MTFKKFYGIIFPYEMNYGLKLYSNSNYPYFDFSNLFHYIESHYPLYSGIP